MKSDELLSSASNELLRLLGSLCVYHKLIVDRNRLTFHLSNGIKVYIRYNNYKEYSYVIQFSPKKQDRIRFDNYDTVWGVTTKPHHYHTRNSDKVSASPMVGEPKIDMSELYKILIDN